MSGKTNLVMFLFGLFVAVVAARSLDLRDFKEPQPATNEQNFEDLVNEVPDSPRTLNQRVRDELMANLLNLLGKVDAADPYEYIPPIDSRPEFPVSGSDRFVEGSLSKRSKGRYHNNPWCNLVDIWKGQGSGSRRCR